MDGSDPSPLAEAGPTPQPSIAPSFDSVVDTHHDRLLRVATLLCGDAAQAEDAVAEAFARTFRPWQRGDVRDVAAYLRRAVVNEVYGSFRRRDRRRRAVRRIDAPAERHLDDDVSEKVLVWRAIETLPVRQRAALVLRYFDDLSEAQTAEVLDMPIGTVKSTVARGLERLRCLLEEGGPHA